MPMATEEGHTTRNLVVAREPVGPKNAGSKGSVGDTALMDGVFVIAVCWVLVLMLAFSLHKHNV